MLRPTGLNYFFCSQTKYKTILSGKKCEIGDMWDIVVIEKTI